MELTEQEQRDRDRDDAEFINNPSYSGLAPNQLPNHLRKKTREEKLETKRNWYKNHGKPKHADYNLRTNYGITMAEFTKMVDAVEGRCEICKAYYGMQLCVDHDKFTGAISGVLCKKCNSGIGFFGEDPEA